MKRPGDSGFSEQLAIGARNETADRDRNVRQAARIEGAAHRSGELNVCTRQDAQSDHIRLLGDGDVSDLVRLVAYTDEDDLETLFAQHPCKYAGASVVSVQTHLGDNYSPPVSRRLASTHANYDLGDSSVLVYSQRSQFFKAHWRRASNTHPQDRKILMTALDDLASLLRSWVKPDETVEQAAKKTTSSRLPIPAFYAGPANDRPGSFPFGRGITERMYHDELWVMGMYSGYVSPKETNTRFRNLLAAGQTGLSIALDLPTQIGVDSDDPLAAGEVGKVGVPLNSVEDMLALLDGLSLHQVRQMRSTANAIGPIFAAFVIVALEELAIDPAVFRLFLQNDPLKEFSSRGTWIFPPGPSARFAVDAIEYFAKHHPTWQPIQFCGYHVRDTGGTAVQEVAVATANGIAYLDEAERRGVEIAGIAPSLFLFLSSSVDIFEEAAKFRAARRLWARLLHKRYGVPEEKTAIKIFSYTLGGALAAHEPQNNIVRVAYEALGAVLGGVQTLATSSWDEAHSLPSEEAAHLALRTQQILAHETGVTKVVDPLAGSYYVEALTRRLENEITRYAVTLLEHGGAIGVIESGFLTQELADAAYRDYQEVCEGERLIVGVNFKPSNQPMPENLPFAVPPGTAEEAIGRLQQVRTRRNAQRLRVALDGLCSAAREGRNTVPALLEATRARATIGEITETLATVFGRHDSSVEYGAPLRESGALR